MPKSTDFGVNGQTGKKSEETIKESAEKPENAEKPIDSASKKERATSAKAAGGENAIGSTNPNEYDGGNLEYEYSEDE